VNCPASIPTSASPSPNEGKRSLRSSMAKSGWAICVGVFFLGVLLIEPGLLSPLSFTIMAICALGLARVGIGGTRIITIVALLFGLLFASTIVFLAVETPSEFRRAYAHTTAVILADHVKEYRQEYGFYPAGNNAEIIRALCGDNPRKVVFFEPHGDLSAAGELLDPWGTPYRFDLSDPKNPKIYSFGKNKRDDHGADRSDDICDWKEPR
jgi:Type II secretion system (T2SS), protein G